MNLDAFRARAALRYRARELESIAGRQLLELEAAAARERRQGEEIHKLLALLAEAEQALGWDAGCRCGTIALTDGEER